MSVKFFKKAALVLATAGVSMAAGVSHAATANGDATATVIQNITITKGQALSFGKFAAMTGGTVVVGADGARSKTGNVVLSGTNVGQKGTMTIGGDANATYTVTLPANGTVTLSDGATAPTTMAVDNFVSTPSGTTGLLSSTGAQTVNVGATLTVASGQKAATYNGTYAVAVEYN